MTPTEAGVILAKNARIILDQLTIAEEEVRGHNSEPAGEVRLGLPGTISGVLSVPLITATYERFPKIKIRIAEAMSGFVLEWMRDSRIDLAVVYQKVDDRGIETIRLIDEELDFFGAAPDPDQPDTSPAGDEISFADLLGLPLILPSPNHGLRELLAEQAASIRMPVSTVIDIDSYGNIKELVKNRLGYSILPANSISSEVEAGKLRRWKIVEPTIRRSVHLAYSSERPMNNAVTAIRSASARFCTIWRRLADGPARMSLRRIMQGASGTLALSCRYSSVR